MKNFQEEDVKETMSQEDLEDAKSFFEYRLAANQTQLERVDTELLTAEGDRKKFLVKSKAGYEAKIASTNVVLTKVNEYLANYEVV